MTIAQNILDSVRYLSYRLRYPSRSDILKQSFGIARRARDFAPQWELHRSLCRTFLRESLALDPTANSISIIGAGRLLDLDTDFLPGRVKQITLIDVDPSLSPVWMNFKRLALHNGCAVITKQLDITGVFDTLPAMLAARLRQNASNPTDVAVQYLTGSLEIIKPAKLQTSDITLSLNILSQLPILFRERITQILLQFRVIPSEEEIPVELVTVVDKVCAALQHAHLETLATSSSKLMVLIADKQFEYYQPHSDARQIESALYFDVASSMSQHTLQLQTNWVWHIAPYGENSQDYGSEHIVGAWAWSPRNPVN